MVEYLAKQTDLIKDVSECNINSYLGCEQIGGGY